MNTLEVNTPEELHQAIGKFLQSDYSHENLIVVYEDARKCANRFRVTYSALPKVPTYNNDPLDGLQEIGEWCDKSVKLVDDIVSDLNQQTISEVISQLKKLRGVADSVLSLVDTKLKEQAQKEARAKVEKEYKNLDEEASKTKGMLLIQQVEVAMNLELEAQAILKRETKDAVQIYLSKDPTFKNRVSQLDNEICEALERLNKLVGSDTPIGKLLDIYCKLKSIPLQSQFDDVGYAYSPIDDWADVICVGCNRLYISIGNVIKTFEEIQKEKRQRPMLFTCNAVESYAVPHWAKVQAKGRKIRILTRPFKCGLGMATDRVTTENEEVFAFNQVLSQDQLDLINRTVGSEELGKIKAFLIQKCNVPDPTNLTWNQILDHLEVYLHSQKAEKPAGTKKIVGTTSNITTEDIDKLLELFRQLENLLNPELPPRDGQLWFKAMEQSRKELADKLKKRQSGFTLRPGRKNLKRDSIKARHPKKEEQAERIICQMAEKKYRLWDSKYNQSLSQVEEKIVEVVKRIDRTLYSMKEPLLAFDRTQGTLLHANFRNIRDDFTVNEIRQFQDQDMVNKSIDALEAIRLKVERQQHLEAPIRNHVSPNKKNAKTTFAAIIISLSVICIFLLSVWLIPFTPFAWLKNHPNSYPLQGSIICLIPCVFVGFLKPQWRKWCWGSAVAFVVLILSLA